MDGGALQVTVHGVAKCQTQLRVHPYIVIFIPIFELRPHTLIPAFALGRKN